jgi:hypothetical protein
MSPIYLQEYISCAEIWVEYPIKYFGVSWSLMVGCQIALFIGVLTNILFFQKREIDTLLGDILKHLNVDRAFENYYPQVNNITQLSLLGNIVVVIHLECHLCWS